MLSQTALIEISNSLGCSITPQTLRNYIKTGLCHGALNTPNGIEARGILPSYPDETLPEAMAAKAMLEVSGRKLDRISVILAKNLGAYIIKNGTEILKKDNTTIFESMSSGLCKTLGQLELSNDKIIWKKSTQPSMSSILLGKSTQKIKHKEFTIRFIEKLAAEWLTLYVNFSSSEFIKIKQQFQSLHYLLMLRPVLLADFENTYVGYTNEGFTFSNERRIFLSIVDRVRSYSHYADEHPYECYPLLKPVQLKANLNQLLRKTKSIPEFISFSKS